MEHYDNQETLHCYQEYSQGPCKEGHIFYQPVGENGTQKNPKCLLLSPDLEKIFQPDDGDFTLRQIIRGPGFEILTCESGQSFDIITKKCRKTSSHNNTKNTSNGPIRGKKNVLEFLRYKIQLRGR